jgi:hypothetical protein
MASIILQELMQRSTELNNSEKLELISHLANSVRVGEEVQRSHYRWSDIEGALPYPIVGEDAQEWVTRSREESDERLSLMEKK